MVTLAIAVSLWLNKTTRLYTENLKHSVKKLAKNWKEKVDVNPNDAFLILDGARFGLPRFHYNIYNY